MKMFNGPISGKVEDIYYDRKTKRKHRKYREDLAQNLKENRQEGNTGKELARTLLEENKGTHEYFYSSLGKKGKNGIKIAENFIEGGSTKDDKRLRAYDVANNLDKFQGKYQIGIVDIILKYADARVVAKNIDKIQEEHQIEVAEKIMEKDVESMAEHIDKLKEKYQIEVAEKMVKNTKNGKMWLEIYHKEITEKLAKS